MAFDKTSFIIDALIITVFIATIYAAQWGSDIDKEEHSRAKFECPSCVDMGEMGLGGTFIMLGMVLEILLFTFRFWYDFGGVGS